MSKKEITVHVYISFNEMWLKGFIARGEDSSAQFKDHLRRRVEDAVRNVTTYPVRVKIDSSNYTHTSAYTVWTSTDVTQHVTNARLKDVGTVARATLGKHIADYKQR